MNYGLVGGGKANKKVVYDALSDVYKPTDVFYIADNLIGDQSVKTWLEATEPQASFVPVDELFTSLANDKEAGRQVSLLILWDDEKPELMEKYAFRAADHKIKILDVSNGLTPIIVETPEAQEVVEKEEVAPSTSQDPLTYNELMSLPMGKLKQMAAKHGNHTKELKTKSALAEAVLLGNAEKKEEEENIELPIDLGTFKIVSSTGTTCTVVVVFSDGRVVTGQAPEHKVAEAFGFTT